MQSTHPNVTQTCPEPFVPGPKDQGPVEGMDTRNGGTRWGLSGNTGAGGQAVSPVGSNHRAVCADGKDVPRLVLSLSK